MDYPSQSYLEQLLEERKKLERDIGMRVIHECKNPEYAKEELRAKMASVYLSMDLGLPVNTFSHAAYTQSWLKELKNDKMEFFKASNDAIKITNYLHNLD